MERIISPEERIRRAEEIYYRRKNQGVRVASSSVNIGEKRSITLKKKMIIQILACVIIYVFFWCIKSNNNLVSNNIINETKAILNYDINFQNLYNQILEYCNNNLNGVISTENEAENVNNLEQVENNNTNEVNTQENIIDTENIENVENNNEIQDNNVEIETNTENLQTEQLGVGGGTENVNIVTESKTQMELDAEYIKQNYSLIVPVSGVVTSRFGNREATEIVTKEHYGIDLGAIIGTPIYASMEGTVIVATFAEDYGNYIKIQNGDIITVYAHCSELNVNVGDYITQGKEIAKVGDTGKVTGPHLHFEIRKEDRFVDPELLLNF